MTRPQALDLAAAVFMQRDFGEEGSSDRFFEEYGPGNTLEGPSTPYERFVYYRDLLSRLQKTDDVKFKAIHKGTPLYFLSWLAFDIQQYEAALQYIDAAIAEDKRNAKKDKWLGLPGPQFILLNAKGGVAERTVDMLTRRVEKELTRFNEWSDAHSQDGYLQLHHIRQFARELLTQDKSAIVAGFYAFLLEFDDRVLELELRSDPAHGSYQPLFLHLFKGGLLLETILKNALPDEVRTLTLAEVMQTDPFKEMIGFKPPGAGKIRPAAEILTGAAAGTREAAFQATGRLCNTVAHNLILEPLAKLPEDYKVLVHHELNALLYTLTKLVR